MSRTYAAAAFLLILCHHQLIPAQTRLPAVPPVRREFRAVWIATVNNIDWPSAPGLPAGQQRQELLRILDLARDMRLNAVILQVRPQCDALYPSRLEPWSEFLTGRMGEPPAPLYDPLAFAVAEAHARGLELHAWFNPYRALHPSAKGPVAASHISRTRPDIALPYGEHVWLDPGERAGRDHSLAVVLDVVRRYDIDGVHFDDYFYPYKEKDEAGREIPFPDERSWRSYVASGGRLGRDDWRRQNVDEFIRRTAAEVRRVKPRVKFGVSPFGIWRPGHPPQIKGFDAYSELYADSRKWLREGWVDYLSPQLYWPVGQEAQSYTALLDWWLAENVRGRHIWPGNAAYRVGGSQSFPAGEIVEQVRATRARLGATGNIFFSAKSLVQNLGGVSDLLKSGPYAEPALIPATPWLDRTPPRPPAISVASRAAGLLQVNWRPRGSEGAFRWVVRARQGARWRTEVLPAAARSYAFESAGRQTGEQLLVVVSAVDRSGNESRPAYRFVR
jgi:uncharacterized lipoprotein YddW (UPF0748 family)